MAPPPPEVSPDDARRVADEVLARAEYLEPQPSLVARALDWVGRTLGNLIEALTGGGPGSVIALVVLGLLLAAAVWFILRSLAPGSFGRFPELGPATAQAAHPLDDPARWEAEAIRLAAAGDRRGALRCRYRAMLAQLVVDRVVPAVPGRTPRELAAELTERVDTPSDATADVVADRFEAVWFGGQDVSDGELAEFTVATRRVVELAAAPAGVPA